MNEPATGEIPPQGMRFGKGQEAHERFHNQYALLMAMGTVDGLRRAMPELRTFILSRAGSAGIQRYAANWMGDNCSRWDHLWMSMPMALGFGVSGQPFVGADIGGFSESSNAELFVRWMQCGVLTPFCRNHSELGNIDQYAWAFGDVIEELCRQALGLRYRLMPYLYAHAREASRSGAPVMRAMALAFPTNPLLRGYETQFMCGDTLLVAPVLANGVRAWATVYAAQIWGAEAAAGSSIGMAAGASRLVAEFNRAFWYALVHVPTGTPLFLGRLDDPSTAHA